jgi:hypothetical protein
MATEQDRANLTGVRGKQAAKMDHDAAKDYIKGSAKMDKDYQGTAEETAGVAKKQQTQEILGSFKKGGKVMKTGAYKLHKGETVIPSGMRAHGKNSNMIRKGSAAMSEWDKDGD